MLVNIGNHRVVPISNKLNETQDIVTIEFQDNFAKISKPGQFLMLWIPNFEEIPMSISSIRKDTLGLSIAKRGVTTQQIHNLRIGDKIGIRGPLGNGFSLDAQNPIIVGGGIGLAPLMPLIEHYKNKDNLKVIVGAQTSNKIPFLKRLKSFEDRGIDITYYTDDGTFGEKGTTINGLLSVDLSKHDIIYTCGPELMMKKIYHIAIKEKIKLEASLERYMKCGVGICGHCAMDPIGWRVCKDGPVANLEILMQLKEFGMYYRDKYGLKINFT